MAFCYVSVSGLVLDEAAVGDGLQALFQHILLGEHDSAREEVEDAVKRIIAGC